MSQRLKKADQAGGEHEAYETPAWCVHRLLEAVDLPGGLWLEPCAATGAIVRAVDSVRNDVTWTACEIREECGDALVEATNDSDEVIMGDFLADGFLRGFDKTARRGAFAFDVCLTNYPFSLATSFIETCRPRCSIVVALLPMPFFGTTGRGVFFERNMPEAIYQLPDRPQFAYGASNSLEYGWFVWGPTLRNPRLGTALHRLAGTPPEERGVKPRNRRATG